MNHHMDKATEERLRAEAWVGDAILALYVREWILAEEGAINGKLFVEFTSNRPHFQSGRPGSSLCMD